MGLLDSLLQEKASMPTDLTMSADYLTQIDLKLAAKFKKEVNVMGELPPGSPTVNEIVQFFKETSPEKFNPPPVAEEASKKKKKKCKEEKSAVDVIAQVEEDTVPTKKKNKNKKAKVDPEVVEKPSEVEVEVPALKEKSKKSKKN